MSTQPITDKGHNKMSLSMVSVLTDFTINKWISHYQRKLLDIYLAQTIGLIEAYQIDRSKCSQSLQYIGNVQNSNVRSNMLRPSLKISA